MQKSILIIFLLLLSFQLPAQPDIKYGIYFPFQKCFTQVNKNLYHDFLTTSTNSLYSIGNYKGASNDVIFSKLNSSFDTVWTKIIGGSNDDEISNILELKNGHILLTGTTSSHDGDLWYGHVYSAKEIWVLEVDTLGNFINGITYGGGNSSDLADTKLTSDGKILMAGSTIAKDYDFTHTNNWGLLDSDGWIALLDEQLHLKWVQFYGGDSDEGCGTFDEIAPNKFIFTCNTGSTLDTVTLGNQSKGDADVLVGMTDSLGNIYWKKRVGSSDIEEVNLSLVDTANHFIYLIGLCGLASGDITYVTGTGCACITKMDDLGNILHYKGYGPTNKGILVEDAFWYQNHLWITATGDNGAGGGDMEINQNNLSNGWIGMVDTNANLVGKFTINGERADFMIDKNCVTGNDIYINAYTMGYLPNSQTCNPTSDSVATKLMYLSFAPLGINEVGKASNNTFDVFPNPSENEITVRLNSLPDYAATLKIYSSDGKLIEQQTVRKQQTKINCLRWTAGNYRLVYEENNLRCEKQFVKK